MRYLCHVPSVMKFLKFPVTTALQHCLNHLVAGALPRLCHVFTMAVFSFEWLNLQRYFTIFCALIGTPLQDRLVCLPMWDLLRVICWLFSVALCWFAFQRAVTVGATVLPVQGGRFARPSPHSAYTYTPSGASPAQLATPCFGPLGWRPRP